MKNSIFISFLICLLSLPAFPQKQAHPRNSNILLGKWETVEEPGQITKISLTFFKDDSVEYREMVRISGSYIFNDNQLVTFFRDATHNTTHIDTISTILKGNDLFETLSKQGRVIRIKSVRTKDMKKGRGIIGKWYTDNYNHFKAYQTFNADRSVDIDLIAKQVKGTYKATENEFTITSSEAAPMVIQYKIEKNILTITDPNANGPMKLEKK